MLNSLVLDTYSPIIVPLTFIYGVNYIEKELVFGKLNILGFLFLIISFLIYYDRVPKHKKEFLIAGLTLFIVSYIILSYTQKWTIGACLALTSLLFICHGIIEVDFSIKSQYIYLSLFMLFVGLVFLIPYERNKMVPYNLSLIVISLSITILVFITIKLPSA